MLIMEFVHFVLAPPQYVQLYVYKEDFILFKQQQIM